MAWLFKVLAATEGMGMGAEESKAPAIQQPVGPVANGEQYAAMLAPKKQTQQPQMTADSLMQSLAKAPEPQTPVFAPIQPQQQQAQQAPVALGQQQSDLERLLMQLRGRQ